MWIECSSQVEKINDIGSVLDSLLQSPDITIRSQLVSIIHNNQWNQTLHSLFSFLSLQNVASSQARNQDPSGSGGIDARAPFDTSSATYVSPGAATGDGWPGPAGIGAGSRSEFGIGAPGIMPVAGLGAGMGVSQPMSGFMDGRSALSALQGF